MEAHKTQSKTLGAMILGASLFHILSDKFNPKKKAFIEIEQQVTYCLLLECFIEDELNSENVASDYFEAKVELQDARNELITKVIRYF